MSRKIWDCESFLKGHLDSYPFSYDTVIVYRGCSEQIFFSKEHTEDRKKDQQSILAKRQISSENGYSKYYTQEEVQSGNHAVAEPGVFCGYFETALSYAKDVVLKIEVPVEFLEVVAMPEEEIGKSEGRPHTYALDSNEQLDRLYGSPERMRFLSQKSMEHNSGEARMDYVMFKINREIPVTKDENWIKGVYDTNFSDRPVFESFEDYVSHLKSLKPDKLPEGVTPVELKKLMKNEVETLEKLVSEVEALRRDGLEIINTLNAFRAVKKDQRKAIYRTLEKECRDYRKRIQEIKLILEEKYEASPEFSQINEFPRTDKVEENFGAVINELENMIDVEKNRFSKIGNNDYSVEDYRAEKKLEKNMDTETIQIVNGLPDLSVLDNRNLLRELLEA